MVIKLENKVFNTVVKHGLIVKHDNIILGLSGGPDSMALLHILLSIKDRIDFKLIIAHINHGVRGEDALKDEMFVKKTAQDLNLPYFSKQADMIGLAKEEGISAEEAGRKIRYGFFREIIKRQGRGKIAVAHNKKDQAETLLMRIMRGTGIDGLKGMDFKTLDIIRPLLDIDRWEIEDYIRKNSIDTVLDTTNLETIYARNKVRLELMPYIESNFNPNIVDTLFRLSENASLDSEFLESYTSKRYKHLIGKTNPSSITFRQDTFTNEDLAIQRRLIRKAILELTGSLQGLEDIHVSNIIELFQRQETGKMINLPNSIAAKVVYDDLIIEDRSHKADKTKQRQGLVQILKPGKNILEDHGIELDLEVVDFDHIYLKSKAKNIKYFDHSKIVGNLMVRTRKNGDKFNPFGMQGSKKIKDYFIDEKIPRDLRNQIPLLIDETNILWVIGYRTSEIYKLDKAGKKVLKVEIKTIKNQEADYEK